jgi:hypothetical protein
MVGFFHLKEGRGKRGEPKRADYLLRYTRDFTVAVVEAKVDYRLIDSLGYSDPDCVR